MYEKKGIIWITRELTIVKKREKTKVSNKNSNEILNGRRNRGRKKRSVEGIQR